MAHDVDYYELLSVRRSASGTEIKRAFRKRARLYHPDLNPGDPVAAQRFQAIAMAFEILSDPDRRQRYDRGEKTVTPSVHSPNVEFHGFDFVAGGQAPAGSIRDLFSDHAARKPINRGDDITQTAHLTFDEAFRGTSRTLDVVRMDHCPACEGAGEIASEPRPCATCKGRGALQVKRGRLVFSRRCGSCGGTGMRSLTTCGSCGGDGRVVRSEQIALQVPPGTRGGSRLRLTGMGHAGLGGAPPGDFVLAIDVAPDPVFRTEGDDLVAAVSVSAIDAALGARVDAPTPDGPLTIEIPAGTQNAQRFRLRKRGLPRPGDDARDDLFVEVRVQVPRVVDDRCRALLEEFRRLNEE